MAHSPVKVLMTNSLRRLSFVCLFAMASCGGDGTASGNGPGGGGEAEFSLRVGVTGPVRLAPGGRAEIPVDVQWAGEPQPVQLLVEGATSALSAAFEPTQLAADEERSSLVLTAGNGASEQVVSLTLRGRPAKGDDATTTLEVRIVRENVSDAFVLFLTPAALELVPGGSVSAQVRLERRNGFAGDVDLRIEVLPEDITARFEPEVLSGTETRSTLRLSAEAGIAKREIGITVVGHAEGGSSHGVPATITVKEPSSHSLDMALNTRKVILARGQHTFLVIDPVPSEGLSGGGEIVAEGLPAGVEGRFTAEGEAEGTETLQFNMAQRYAKHLRLRVAAEAPLGESTFSVRARNLPQGVPDSMTAVELVVVDAESSDTPGWSTISAGGGIACGVRGDQTYCWGEPVGNLSGTVMRVPTVVSGGHTFSTVSSGSGYSCALDPDGGAHCWGIDLLGKLGDGESTELGSSRHHPGPVAGGLEFESIALGTSHACAITKAGKAYCWGGTSLGNLGEGTVATGGNNDPSTYRAEPVAVHGDLTFTQIAAGNLHTCGLTTEGAIWCWGWNDAGRLGDGTTQDSAVPVRVDTSVSFVQVAVGMSNSWGLTADGELYAWGAGIGMAAEIVDLPPVGFGGVWKTPVRVPTTLRFSQITGSERHACGLTTEGKSHCWGSNGSNELGTGDEPKQSTRTPIATAGGLTFRSLAAGRDFTCGIDTAGKAWCWGWFPGTWAEKRPKVPVRLEAF